MDGRIDVLGMYVGENESEKFRFSILNGLKNRSVRDILIACIDGLIGFTQDISAVFSETEIQHCIIHQIRNSTRFVSYKDIKAIMTDLKASLYRLNRGNSFACKGICRKMEQQVSNYFKVMA